MIARALALVAGVGLIGATCHATILANGGYAERTAPMLIALAVGAGVGAISIGAALGAGRRLQEALQRQAVARQAVKYEDAERGPLDDQPSSERGLRSRWTCSTARN